MIDLFSLNPKQKEAVLATEGPVLVVAGAGAGKTKVLTERIRCLVEKHSIPPEKILAVTFTNKAAEEMRQRLGLSGPLIGTFHALGLFIIKENLKELGISENFTIMDEDDALKLIKVCEEELRIDPKQFDPSRIRNQISGLKNKLIAAENFADDPSVSSETNNFFGQILSKIWQLYEKKKEEQHFLDFDDLLLKPTNAFKRNPDLLKKYRERWQYLHIDEYQDTNEVQYTLSKLLAGAHRNIFVVGDIDQAIYSWRGADFKNVLNFQLDWPDAKVITLEENYRSTDIILEAANALITNNKMRLPKNLWTKRAGKHQIRIIYSEDDKKEAETVAKEIAYLKQNAVSLKNIGILYRTNAQSRALEEALLKYNIHYRILSGTRFYERKEIKDILAYLKLIQNSADELSKKRIINVPPRKKKKINFEELIEKLRNEAEKTTPNEFLKILLSQIGYREYIDDGTEKGFERWQNIEELLGLAGKMETLKDFLEHVSLFAVDDKNSQSAPDANDHVNMMTMHSAKGLEFDTVFVVGLEEGLFPHMLSYDPQDLEEERRLCYVALTRAKNRLYLTLAGRRTLFGDRVSNMPSRFLSEIPEHLVVFINKPYGYEEEEDIIIE